MKSVLDSRQLLAAKALAITGSFTLAGRYLSLTQSAVSHAIKALEEEIGWRLFARTGKGVKLTPAGRHFLQHLDRILEQMEIARTLVSPRGSGGKESLRVGVSTRARDYFLPVVKPAFQKEYPNRLIVLEPGDYRDGLQLVQSGLLDLCFSVKPVDRADTAFAPLFDDELAFIVAAGHPWARRRAAVPDDLARGMLMLHQAFNNTPVLLGNHLKQAGITARHAVELVDYQQIKNVVLTGQCVGVLPPWLVASELKSGALIALNIGREPLVREWGLAYDRARKLTPIELRFIELCRQAVPGILSRLRGDPLEPNEKKAGAPIPLAEARTGNGAVVAGLGGVASWLWLADWLDAAATVLTA